MSISRFHLFQAYGVELEYMIVDKTTLAVRPIADELLKAELGQIGSDFENGPVTWSNELVMHVIELKSTQPESNLNALENYFVENVRRINARLSEWNAKLLPTAAHPLMNPATDTQLWPHDNNEVYALYNSIFDCRGHGWSNLQSTHLNLPFYDDEEFARLHAAIRIVLPLLPALCASSPVLDGKLTGKLDTRLHFYQTNQAKLPSITGRVIPEAIFSKRNYLHAVYERIQAEIQPFDTQHILDPVWVNSRGAIPRFDRGSIEIRIMDIQECPAADLAIVALVTEFMKALATEKFVSTEEQMGIKTEQLVSIYQDCLTTGRNAVITDPAYLALFGIEKKMTIAELWSTLFQRLCALTPSLASWKNSALEIILTQGTLSERMLQHLGTSPTEDQLRHLYHQLSDCLAQNKVFIP